MPLQDVPASTTSPSPSPSPRLLGSTVAESTVPLVRPWWMEFLVLGTVGCATAVFLLLTIIICYKAIKRKPLRKEENGTSRGEYTMSSRKKKKKKKKTNNVGINNAVV